MTIDLEDYSLARVIKGIYDSEYKTIATDDEGNIVGVFKGIYGTTLHTIKVDSQGRMLAIITDPEDVYGNIHMVGNAELAARLGSINTYDRRGDTIWMDDFENANATKWGTDIDTGGSAALSTDRAWMGNQSMKTVTDDDAGDDVILAKAFCLPTEQKMAAEMMYYMYGGKPIVMLKIVGYTGTSSFTGHVKYDHNTQQIHYYDSGGNPVELTRTDSNVTVLEPWFLMKLVVDWDTQEYIRFIFCSTEYDLSGISMQSTGNGTKKHIEVYIYNEAGTAAASTVYFDNFILTQNEP